MIRSIGDWLRQVTRATFNHDAEAEAKLKRPWDDGGYGSSQADRRAESEIVESTRLAVAIICAMRDGNWNVLTIVRNQVDGFEECCGEFLKCMGEMAKSESEKDFFQMRLAEFEKWKSEKVTSAND